MSIMPEGRKREQGGWEGGGGTYPLSGSSICLVHVLVPEVQQHLHIIYTCINKISTCVPV